MVSFFLPPAGSAATTGGNPDNPFGVRLRKTSTLLRFNSEEENPEVKNHCLVFQQIKKIVFIFFKIKEKNLSLMGDFWLIVSLQAIIKEKKSNKYIKIIVPDLFKIYIYKLHFFFTLWLQIINKRDYWKYIIRFKSIHLNLLSFRLQLRL